MEGEPSKTWWDLPLEMKTKVFSYLSKQDLMRRASLVCKAWQQLALDPALWRSVTFSGRRMTADVASSLISRMTQLVSLTLVLWNSESDELLRRVSESQTALETLNVCIVTIESKDTLELVANRCEALKELNLDHVTIPDDSRNLLDIFASNAKLQTMSFYCFHDRALPLDRTVARDWKQLSTVWIQHDFFGDDELAAIVRNAGENLQSLSIMNLSRPESYLMLQQCPKLDDLRLSTPLTRSALLTGIGNLNLRYLSVECGTGLTSGDWSAFFSSLTFKLEKLEMVNTVHFKDECLLAITSNCHHLTDLTLESCPGITIDGLIDLVTHCRSLRSLTVNYCFHIEEGVSFLKLHTYNTGLHIRLNQLC